MPGSAPVPVDDCFAEFVASGIEDTRLWFNFINTVKEAGMVYYNQEIRQFRIHKAKPEERLLKYQPSSDNTQAAEESFVNREASDKVEVHFSSGGWINVVTLKPSLDGHSEVTKQVLANTLALIMLPN